MLRYKYIRRQEFECDPADVMDNHHTLEGLRGKFVVKTPDGYIVFESPERYEEFFSTTPEPARQFHEVIFNLPQKLRFDIDAKRAEVAKWIDPIVGDTLNEIAREFGLISESDDVLWRFDRVISGVLNAVLDTFLLVYGRDVGTSDVIICKSSGGEKCSAHIVVDGYFVSGAEQAREFCQQVMKVLPAVYHGFMDVGVYKTTQNFRLTGCSKGDGRVKTIVTGQPAHRSFITDVRGCAELRDIVGKEAPRELITTKMPPEDVEAVLELCATDESFRAHKFLKSRDNQLYFSRISPSYCSFCCRQHDSDNTAGVSVTYGGGVGIAYKFCRKSSAEGVKIGQFRSVTQMNIDPERVKTSEREANIRSAVEWSHRRERTRTLFDALPAENRRVYCESALRPFELAPTLVVHAAMKMGKTKALQEFVSRHFTSGVAPPVVRILSFRQTFSGNIKEKFPDFVLYSDVKGPIDHPRVIIQVESLHRLAIRPGMEVPDLVIMDECESIFEQFNSGLLRGNFNDCFAKFQYLIRHSRHLICLDAGISDRTYRILRQMRPNFERVIYHRNEYQNATEDTYYFCGARIKWLSYLYKSVEDGLRVSVPISSLVEAKALARDIGRKFPTKTVRIYSSETSASDKREHFSNVHTYWGVCDVLIYTPTVSAGVSFELKRFDRVFGYFTDQSCPAETCVQMLGRVRDVALREYYICIQSTGNSLPDTEEAVKGLLYDRRTHLLSEYEVGGLQMSYTASGHVQYHGDYFQLWTENTIVRNKSINRFAKRLIGTIADSGAVAEFLTDEMYEEEFGEPLVTDGALNDAAAVLEGDIKAAKSGISAEECERIAAARDINEDEVEQIRSDIGAQRDIPQDLHDAYEKYRLRSDYKYGGEIDPAFVAKYRPRPVRRTFRNLSRVMGRDGEEAWRAMMAEERAVHEYRFTDDDIGMQNDINRTYVSDSHRYALSLLRLFGWTRIDDQSVRNRDRILAELDEKMYWNNITAACASAKIRPPSLVLAGELRGEPGKYLDMMIKPVNKMLFSLYGVKLTHKYKDATLIGLTTNVMFATTEAGSLAKKMPWLRPSD